MAGGGGPVDAASGMVFAGRCARRVGCAFALVLAHAEYPTGVPYQCQGAPGYGASHWSR